MIRRSLLVFCLTLLAACGTTREAHRGTADPHYKIGQPYKINGKTYYPTEQPENEAIGVASWYGDAFDGKRTANGEIFDKRRLSAAHTTMPLPSLVEVENLENGRRVVVRVNDRGPFVDNRLIDLSHAAARALDFDRAGLAQVRVRYLGRAQLAELAPIYGSDRGTRIASAPPPTAATLAMAPVTSAGSTAPSSTAGVLAMAPVDTGAPAGPPPQLTPSAPLDPAAAPAIEMTPLAPLPESPNDTGERMASLGDRSLTPPTAVRTEYWITVAQFFGLSELEGAMKSLASFGNIRMVSDAGGVGYRLQMGPYPDEASANATLAVLKEAGYPDALIADELCYAPPAGSNLATC
jgi:rare lipoprotein A